MLLRGGARRNFDERKYLRKKCLSLVYNKPTIFIIKNVSYIGIIYKIIKKCIFFIIKCI